MTALSVLIGIYIFSVIFFWVECYFDHITALGEDEEVWKIMLTGLIPVLNTLVTIVYGGTLIFKNSEVEEGSTGLYRDMHRVHKCRNCEINSYKGRVIENHNKCPFCDYSDMEIGWDAEGAPLSLKMSFWKCVSIARTATKIHQDYLKGKHKYATEEFKKELEIKQAKEEYEKIAFKDKQIELYLNLRQGQLDELAEQLIKEKSINDR